MRDHKRKISRVARHGTWSAPLTRLALLLVLFAGGRAGAQPPAKDRPAPEREQLGQKAKQLDQAAYQLYREGKYAEASQREEEAVAILRRVYPVDEFPAGHPVLGKSLNNLGVLLHARGEYAKAQAVHEEALAMHQRLYPKDKYPAGHPALAQCVYDLGLLYQGRREYARAQPLLEEALAIRRRLYPVDKYPAGHPYLAQNLHSLGFVLNRRGESTQALPLYEEALAMQRRLYPPDQYPAGHPDLALSLNNLGFLRLTRGEYVKALPLFEGALAMQRARLDQHGSSEAEALALAGALPPTRDNLLSVTRQVLPVEDKGYGHVWSTKATQSRILQQRHVARRAALAGSEVRQHWQELQEVRRRLARLLLSPERGPKFADEVRALTDRKERLQGTLGRLLPELPRQKELDRLGPADLAAKLPRGIALVDFVRYTDYTSAEVNASPHYVAFVLAPGKPIERVEFGPAQAIDQAVTAWRQAIDQNRASPAAAQLRRLVWNPIAAKLPSGTRTVYLSPDGDLTRLPWAALPGAKEGTILLEDYTLAVVPHGPFLLEQLVFPPKYPDGPETVLAVGGVRYGKDGPPYPPLPATARERDQVLARATGRPTVALGGAKATPDRLTAELPKARYAHLATHGFFRADLLTEERQRVQRQLKDWQFSMEHTTERVGLGLRSPLSYTGLALAGANDPKTPDGGLLTGEALVELPLEGLRLAVLSACETGLGELTEGEGVQGLVRAFHLAGCANVVASLWQVDDEATAALMAAFYHYLWKEGKPPLEALRQAQLDLYRHPEWMGALARARGGNPFAETVQAVAPVAPARKAGDKTPVKLWAAFVLSGTGR